MNYRNIDTYIGTLNNKDMGLAEQIVAGAVFERSNTSFVTNIAGSGSISVAPSYVLLSINSDKSVRLRLYDTEASLNDPGEIVRSFNNTAVSNSIALIADISMSAGAYTMDPSIYAVSENTMNPLTYYRVENASNAAILINYFPLESNTVIPDPTSVYAISNRRTIHISQSIASNGTVLDTIPPTIPSHGVGTDPYIPNTYLLVSASLNNPTQIARLRLYSDLNSAGLDPNDRPFSSEPTGSFGIPDVGLIADIILSGSETIYFTPKIIGSNLQTIRMDGNEGTVRNLFALRDNPTLVSGFKRIYYKLSNLGPTLQSITASIHVYSLEE